MTLQTIPQQEVINPSSPSDIVENIVPYFTDNSDKNRYLSFRSTGFNVHESCSLTKISYRTVMRWRAADPDFKRIDTQGLTQLRDAVGNQYLRVEWGRNFRMALEKDRQVLTKAIRGQTLTTQENSYLEKVRSQYSPQALSALEEVLRDTGTDTSKFDLTTFIMGMGQAGRQVEMGIRVSG